MKPSPIPTTRPGPLLEGVQPVVVRAPDHERVVALEVAEGEPDGVDERVAAADVALDRVDAGLTVVLRANGHPLGEELGAKLEVVDDVAVVRPDHRAVRVEVRLGVGRRRLAERRPAQLRDPAPAAHLREAVARRDRVDLADVLAQVDRAVAEGRHPDGVVAPVGEPLRGLDQDRPEGLVPVGHVAKDATHRGRSPGSAAAGRHRPVGRCPLSCRLSPVAAAARRPRACRPVGHDQPVRSTNGGMSPNARYPAMAPAPTSTASQAAGAATAAEGQPGQMMHVYHGCLPSYSGCPRCSRRARSQPTSRP